MQFFDTHAHIGLIYEDPIEQLRVVQQAKQAGVTRIMSICNSNYDFERVYSHLKSMPNVYHATGISPSEVTRAPKDWISIIEGNLKLKNVIAIGETGLDYYKQFGDKRRQVELFINHLELAQKHNVPAIIHNRNAGKDILDVLKQKMPDRGVIFHCYSETAEYAQKALELPVYFSFAGSLTYRNSKNLHETALHIPLDRILIETESPFMIPAELRDLKRTKPAFLSATAKFLAELLDIDIETLAAQLWKNSCKAFGLPE